MFPLSFILRCSILSELMNCWSIVNLWSLWGSEKFWQMVCRKVRVVGSCQTLLMVLRTLELSRVVSPLMLNR